VKPVSGKEMCRILERNGWILARIKGRHHAFQHPDRPGTIIVPVHGSRDLRPGTQHGIMNDAGLTEDDLRPQSFELRALLSRFRPHPFRSRQRQQKELQLGLFASRQLSIALGRRRRLTTVKHNGFLDRVGPAIV
jgi:predicted RNA binding protein YcfA (HicA-like mRNA interferase family)